MERVSITIVTDKEGKPVKGLKAEDFEIFPNDRGIKLIPSKINPDKFELIIPHYHKGVAKTIKLK